MKALAAYKQDNCSDGCHIFTTDWHDGRPRCSCGKVMDEHLTDEQVGEQGGGA